MHLKQTVSCHVLLAEKVLYTIFWSSELLHKRLFFFNAACIQSKTLPSKIGSGLDSLLS